ncbi:thioredoxin family protein [Chryseobacterium sp. CBSDS_008]|uniref:thioredoxin family protein n=1 Tax=Chryseobacterium sp. CBSDS_008 TaxID=3415265 RepID=UPI003CF8403E
MRKTTLCIIYSITGHFVFAQQIKFEENRFSEALAKAKRENKLVFLDSYTSWCAPCKLMVNKIFSLPSVSDYYNSNFICTQFDMEKGEGPALAKKYKVGSYPTYLFVDGNGEEVHRALGYMEENEFIQIGKDAQDPTKQISTLKKKFKHGEKDLAFLKNLIQLTTDDMQFNYLVFKRYLILKDKIDNEDAILLFTSLTGYQDLRYKLLQEKKEDIVKVLSQENFDEYNRFIIMKGIRNKTYNKTTKQLDENTFLKETEKFFGKQEAYQLLSDQKANIALENKDYRTYEQMILQKYRNGYTNQDPNELSLIAGTFSDYITTASSLETAILWVSDAEKRKPNPMNQYILGKLYYKLGDNVKAKEHAEKSLEGAKKLEFKDPDFIGKIQDLLHSIHI